MNTNCCHTASFSPRLFPNNQKVLQIKNSNKNFKGERGGGGGEIGHYKAHPERIQPTQSNIKLLIATRDHRKKHTSHQNVPPVQRSAFPPP